MVQRMTTELIPSLSFEPCIDSAHDRPTMFTIGHVPTPPSRADLLAVGRAICHEMGVDSHMARRMLATATFEHGYMGHAEESSDLQPCNALGASFTEFDERGEPLMYRDYEPATWVTLDLSDPVR